MLEISGVVTGSLASLQTTTGALTIVGERGAVPYDGTYEVTPLAGADQILATSGKRLSEDVVVFEIPYYETSNPSGGYTVIIG